MPRLIWSPRALNDLHRHYRFLADKNTDVARRAVKAIRAGMAVLARHPEVGRPAAEMPHEYREWVIDFGDRGYVALYRLDETGPTILAVRHQRESGY